MHREFRKQRHNDAYENKRKGHNNENGTGDLIKEDAGGWDMLECTRQTTHRRNVGKID